MRKLVCTFVFHTELSPVISHQGPAVAFIPDKGEVRPRGYKHLSRRDMWFLTMWLFDLEDSEEPVQPPFKLRKDLWHFDRVSAYFSDASQNFLMHKISQVSFWIGLLMYKEQIKLLIRQADPNNKTGDATKGGGGCKFLIHQNI